MNFQGWLTRPSRVLLATYGLASLFLSGGFGLPHDMSPAARKYLYAALEIIQEKALNREVNSEEMKGDA